MSINSVNNLQNPLIPPDGLKRMIEPKSSLSSFSSVLNGLGSVLGGVGTAALGGMNPEYAATIAMQIEVQQQMMMTSLASNIEKSKHETQMAAVRNIRVS